MHETLGRDAKTILEQEAELATAHLTLDLGIFDRLLHEEYVLLQPNGCTETKQDVMTSIGSGHRGWEIAQVENVTARVYGETAVAQGIWRARGRNGDARFDYAARFVSVWTKHDGHWKNLVYHGVKTPIEGFNGDRSI